MQQYTTRKRKRSIFQHQQSDMNKLFDEQDQIESKYKYTLDIEHVHISGGVELESSVLSYMYDDPRHQSIGQRIQYDKNITIHGDILYPTPKMRSKIQSFRSKIGSTYNLRTISRSIQIDKSRLDIDKMFNDAEFIIKYHTPQKILSSDIYKYMWNILVKSMVKLQNILHGYKREIIISEPDFPYYYMYINDKYKSGKYLLSSTTKPIQDIVFVAQLTLGVEFKKASILLQSLQHIWKNHKESHYKRNMIMCNVIMGDKLLEWPILTNYLYLFIYSFLTRHDRKNNLFVFRNFFSILWAHHIGERGVLILQYLIEHTKYTTFLEYFNKIHITNNDLTYTDRRELQHSMDSTIYYDVDRFYIECRGIRRLFNDFNKSNFKLTLNSFFDKELLFKQSFDNLIISHGEYNYLLKS